ncbi:hypothetical protein M231_03953 [Tremella mesenterica]|uniref:Uncharacterized protein n=1 Tax=Tremella mesenterica TaxID=5217 RepID=A0A4V1M414_TREME|nr:hypothetical protein M231_03953 [Tremella mesenterica]
MDLKLEAALAHIGSNKLMWSEQEQTEGWVDEEAMHRDLDMAEAQVHEGLVDEENKLQAYSITPQQYDETKSTLEYVLTAIRFTRNSINSVDKDQVAWFHARDYFGSLVKTTPPFIFIEDDDELTSLIMSDQGKGKGKSAVTAKDEEALEVLRYARAKTRADLRRNTFARLSQFFAQKCPTEEENASETSSQELVKGFQVMDIDSHMDESVSVADDEEDLGALEVVLSSFNQEYSLVAQGINATEAKEQFVEDATKTEIFLTAFGVLLITDPDTVTEEWRQNLGTSYNVISFMMSRSEEMVMEYHRLRSTGQSTYPEDDEENNRRIASLPIWQQLKTRLTKAMATLGDESQSEADSSESGSEWEDEEN